MGGVLRRRRAAHRRRGHGHDGDPLCGPLGSESPERLDPVNPGQPNVHQDQARAPPLGQPDTLFARLGVDDLIPFERQHVPDELPVRLAQDTLKIHIRRLWRTSLVGAPEGRTGPSAMIFARGILVPALKALCTLPAGGTRAGRIRWRERSRRHGEGQASTAVQNRGPGRD
jgi:hypothetical protein